MYIIFLRVYNFLNFCIVLVNVQKWEETVAEDERELEKLKKDEQKQMKVCSETNEGLFRNKWRFVVSSWKSNLKKM